MKKRLMRVLRITAHTAPNEEIPPITSTVRKPTRTPEPLLIFELLEHILLHLDIRTLLHAQRVSKRWHSVITNSKCLQQALYFLPLPASPSTSIQPRTNLLLTVAFSPYFHILNWEELTDTFPSIWATLMLSSTKKTWTDSVRREEASWRRMLVTQPPVTHVDIVDQRIAPDYEDCFVEGEVTNEEGVRMGELLLVGED